VYEEQRAGAVVEVLITNKGWGDLIDGILVDHDQSGQHKTLTDANGNEWIKQTATASAVNEFTVANAATGNNPSLCATGGDSNIGLELTAKGTGLVETVTGHQFDTEAVFDAEYDNGNSGAADTIDWTKGNKQKSTLTDDVTYTFTAPSGACNLILHIVQDGTGGRDATWPASVTWLGTEYCFILLRRDNLLGTRN